MLTNGTLILDDVILHASDSIALILENVLHSSDSIASGLGRSRLTDSISRRGRLGNECGGARYYLMCVVSFARSSRILLTRRR